MSKRSSKRRKRTASETIFIGMSVLLAISMALSLFLFVLPGPPAPTPTPWPTWTPLPRPTATPVPPEPSPTVAPTEVPMGPVLPTLTLTPTPPPTVTAAPTVTTTPTVTATPATAASPLPADGAAEFTFAVCGDSRGNPTVYRKVLESVATSGSEFLVHTGDLVNEGTEAQWTEFQEIMAGFPLPFYPVPGNHDAPDGKLDGYLAHSGAPAAHYSFERGPVHFTLADSHHGGLSAGELAWLRGDLSATDRPVKMVVLHHPPFDPDGTDHIMAFGNRAFMDLMAELEVDHVFAGHIHAYAQEARDGVVYTITGGAGAPLYSADHPQAFHHYLRVTIQGQDVTVEVISI